MATEAQANESVAAQPRSFPWERHETESSQAYARFVLYRNTPPSERSIRKVGVSMQLAARWSRKFQWVKRALAYDDWQLELSDQLTNRAILWHRHQLVRFGSRSLDKAIAAIDKVDETKLSVNEIGDLAKVGSQLARTALGLSDKQQATSPQVVVQTGVVWSDPTGARPAWLPQPSNQIDNKQNETSNEPQNKVLVNAAEQVIAEPKVCMPSTRLVEKVIACPTVNHNKGKPMGKFD